MKKSQRALAGIVVIDALVALGAGYMIIETRRGVWQSSDPAAAISLISTTAGATIGIVTAILAVAFFVHRGKGN